MTATPSIDLPGWMTEQLAQASPDLLRNMVQAFAEALMSADADAVCGAGYGQRSPDRSNTRNGYRHRGWDTRAGSIDLAIPKLREGTYFPEWLLERRRRAIDVWGGERLQLDTPREFGRPLELTTRCCGQTRTVRGYPCSTCKEPFCPSCQRCRCDRRSQSEVTCSNCYLAYQAHLVVGGLCEECRS